MRRYVKQPRLYNIFAFWLLMKQGYYSTVRDICKHEIFVKFSMHFYSEIGWHYSGMVTILK